MKRWLLAFLVGLMLSVPATKAEADSIPGLRFGLTDDPDTLFLGFQFEFPFSRTRSTIFIFEPGVDAGIGIDDGPDIFTLRGTGHFKFLFPLSRAERISIYPLIGVSLYYVNVDDLGDDTSGGIDLGGGFRWDRFSFEFFFGFDDDDLPDITAAFAIRF